MGRDEEQHLDIINSVIDSLQLCEDNPYVLKGGTSLARCYGLDRFSEDVDLDAAGATFKGESFFTAIDNWSASSGIGYRVKKDTDTTKRVFLDYRDDDHVKVELSLRRATIPSGLVTQVDGVQVYTLSEICRQKCSAYQTRDRIRDLYDVTWICTEKVGDIDQSALDAIRNALEYKGFEQFDYIVRTDHDELIDVDKLETRFLESMQNVGLMTPGRTETAGIWLGRTEPESWMDKKRRIEGAMGQVQFNQTKSLGLEFQHDEPTPPMFGIR